jgi:uncharacterized membrane protein
MIRNELSRQLDHDPNFRWRGEAVTRIENLSDIVFALALGMLVSASNPPVTYQQVLPHLLNIIPVSAGFALMIAIWNRHFTFFRRYGVADSYIIFLNAVLMLFILFVAYPLRFAFDSLFAFVLGTITSDWTRVGELGLRTHTEAGYIVAYFHAGFAFVYLLIERMYSYAFKRADDLQLSASERVITKRSIWDCRVQVLIAVIIVPLASLNFWGPAWGFLGLLNWPAAMFIRRRFKISDTIAEEMPAGETD